ncbi:MAG: serine/threonine-protein kinase [Polyangiaceae bacterium]
MSATATSSNRFPEIDKFELLEEIGHGGMATVYRARDLRLDREVAVKVIHKHLRENAEVRRRFVSEAKAVAKLRHRGIVEVFDVSDEAQEERYLVVELIRGMSMRQLLVEHGCLPAEVAAIIVLTLCDAVQHAHDSAVIHRDIKPENVLIELPSSCSKPDEVASERPEADAERRVSDRPTSTNRSRPGVVIKLTDFGIAKVLDVQGVTSTGQILGSPAHMAPEQIEGGEVGPHTDVFALGVLLYEAMVGHLPFEGKNPAQVLRRVLDGDFEPADAERPEVGGRWARILANALATDVEVRTPSAAALGAAIADELAALGIEDPEAWLLDYFSDEAAYLEQAREVMVPRLLKRGEICRKGGQAPLAADDFNRALALAPDDLAILKRVSNLSSETIWKERGQRLAAIVAGSALLFGASYGVTRWLRPASGARASVVGAAVDPPIVPEPRSDGGPTASPPPTPTPEAAETATTSDPRPKGPIRIRLPIMGTPTASVSAPSADPLPVSGTRKVRFVVIPPGAWITVDGAPVQWFGSTVELSVGNHSFTAGVRDSNCCEEQKGGFNVPVLPEGAPPTEVKVGITLPIRPARFRLSGGTQGDSVTCKGVTSTGNEAAVPMTKVEWEGSCFFSNGAKQSQVLRAGELATLLWPG